MDHVIAIDIGGTNTSFGLVDEQGNIVWRDVASTAEFEQPQQLVDYIYNSISGNPKSQSLVTRGIGIGAPNGNYYKGTIEFAPNLKWKGVVPLCRIFSETFNLPSVLTNDAKAAALGEKFYGAAKEMSDFIFITLGTGLGSGIVVNNELVYGHDGLAGELGHTIVIQHGRPCGCGRRGCLEQYCSATGLIKTYFEILANDPEADQSGSGRQEVDGNYIFSKAMNGDESAFYAFNYTGELLGFALANSVAYTSPEAIFLFGGLAQSGEILFTPTLISFEKNLLTVYRNKIKILPSALPENDAALLGSASLIWKLLRERK